VSVRVALDVEGPARDYLSPGEAIDLLLVDAEFVRQLAANPRERWTGADLTWQDETWVLTLRLDDPSEAIKAVVDALTGDVLSVDVMIISPVASMYFVPLPPTQPGGGG
jgi:hypothetical protein